MNTRKLVCIIAAAVVLMPLAAHAQIVGGTPDTAAAAFANWLQGPMGRPLITVAFLGVGLIMMVGRHTMEGIVFCLIGASFYAGAGGLAGLITGAG